MAHYCALLAVYQNVYQMFNISIRLHKVKKNKEGCFPVAIVLSRRSKRTYLYLGFHVLESEFDNKVGQFRKNHKDYRRRNLILSEKLTRARRINDNMIRADAGTVAQFKAAFSEQSESVDLVKFMRERAEVISDKTNTKIRYKTAANKVSLFAKKKIEIEDVTPEWLLKFEKHLRKEGLNVLTIRSYISTVSAVINYAITNKIVRLAENPFDYYKISKLKYEKKSRALSSKEVKRFSEVVPADEKHLIARHYFMFSFYCRGINFSDMAKLTKENIKGERLEYYRNKTNKFYSIELLPQAKEILSYFSENPTGTKYLFPIFTDYSKTEKQRTYRSGHVSKQVNKRLRVIGLHAKIERSEEITLYFARHSFATILKKSGVSTEAISELLGHEDIKTTKTYLASFDNSELDEAAKNIL